MNPSKVWVLLAKPKKPTPQNVFDDGNFWGFGTGWGAEQVFALTKGGFFFEIF